MLIQRFAAVALGIMMGTSLLLQTDRKSVV